MSTLEQRRRFAEKIGDRVQGTTGGHLRIMDRGATCDGCGGPLPCDCEPPAEDAPDTSEPAAAVVPNHAAAARQRLALVRARGGPKPRKGR